MARLRTADSLPAGGSPKPPGQLSERGRRTRGALIGAARRVFERDGFIDAIRITDIAEEAGAAHGTFYTYFDSKEAALRAVILQSEFELLGAAAAQYQGRRDGPVGRRSVRISLAPRTAATWRRPGEETES